VQDSPGGLIMLRKILKALSSALRAMVRAIDGTWRHVFGSGGGDLMVDDMQETDADPHKAVESAGKAPFLNEHDLRTNMRRDAALVRIYCMKAVMTGERPALAPCLPRAVRDWLPGVDAGGLKLIADATADEVLQHLHKGPHLQGVHRVQRLKPVALVMKTGHADDVPREVADLRPAFGL
jgi:hypothetical protein